MAERSSVVQERNTNNRRRVTVPELYRKAAKILKSAEERKGSVKNLIYSSGYRDVKPMYALVAECCKHREVLERLVNETAGLLDGGIDPHLAKVLVTELVWGKGYLKPEGAKAIRTVLALEGQLKRSLETMTSTTADPDAVQFKVPRYVRVNTLVSSAEDVCSQLAEEGWNLVRLKKKKTSYEEFLAKVRDLGEKDFLMDYHLDFLLVFPPSAQFHDHSLLLNGSILLQDKASCLPPVALSNAFDGPILDACSAPGMKTTLLAALSNNRCPITAVERDEKRCKTLRQTVTQARATSVTVKRADFLQLDPANHPDIKYILVDPSCSGSGIVNRFDLPDSKAGNGDETIRLKKLSSLQQRLLEHAASFPGVQRIVYSTCSIHVEENEAVVRQVLNKVGHLFHLEEALPGTWARRGLDQCDEKDDGLVIGQKCVRVDARSDLTNGFFVALFVRNQSA